MILGQTISRLNLSVGFGLTTTPITRALDEGYHCFPIEGYDVGKRIDRYLKSTPIGWLSAQKYLRSHDIVVRTPDGRIVAHHKYKLEEGDQLLIRKGKDIDCVLLGGKNPGHIELDMNQAKKTLDQMTIFDNENVSVLNKPSGYSVQGGHNLNKNIFSLMAARFRKDMIYISHRLDKPTSGVVIVPKNLTTAQRLGEVLHGREGMDKYYLGLCEGEALKQSAGVMACQLEWTSKQKARMVESFGKQGQSQLAITQYVSLKHRHLNQYSSRNLLGMRLVTGRKHQIRCQLSQYLCNPILNDKLYSGRKISFADDAIFLHSFALCFSKASLIEQIFQISPPP